jgi:hypothetical protein
MSSKTDRIFSYLKLAARILLIISAMLLLLSIMFLFVYGKEFFDLEIVGNFTWITIIVSIYSLFYSVLVIAASLLYNFNSKQTIKLLLKNEILLFILTVILVLAFYFVNRYFVRKYY